MHALGVPTSRSLSLYVSQTEKVGRPWFLKGSYSKDPEVMIEESVAISTRVAPSFLRVGQLELFGRRARKNEHPKAKEELEMIVLHLIDREYSSVINKNLTKEEKVILLAREFRSRLTSLVANWIRVGYCQGNFNGDNCAAGGFTLDYGPFGFIDMFDPKYQPWTGGGIHFSFLNQPQAAEHNFRMFCKAIEPLLESHENKLQELENIVGGFSKIMQEKMTKMWASKLGLQNFNLNIFNELIKLMLESSVDYTIFFRELSCLPDNISLLTKSFYGETINDEKILKSWSEWLKKWKLLINETNPVYINAMTQESSKRLSEEMKQVNPKYTLREWFLVPAYEEAEKTNYKLIKELQEVMTNPYAEQLSRVEKKFYKEKPSEFFEVAGISHVSCSS